MTPITPGIYRTRYNSTAVVLALADGFAVGYIKGEVPGQSPLPCIWRIESGIMGQYANGGGCDLVERVETKPAL